VDKPRSESAANAPAATPEADRPTLREEMVADLEMPNRDAKDLNGGLIYYGDEYGVRGGVSKEDLQMDLYKG